MAIDTTQSFGTLTGLKNKLVLREISGPARIVIIPDGKISGGYDGHHSWVEIDTGSSTFVKYHEYQIDTQLGRLVDNGSPLSRLYRLYLHALTSHCLPDMLTGRTGTEEALYGLSMASTRSFPALGAKELDLLELVCNSHYRRVVSWT